MRAVISLLVLVISGIPGTVFAVPGDYGYRFIHTNVVVRNLTQNYGAGFNSAAADYQNAGNITFSAGPSNLDPPFSGHVAFHEFNFGPTGFAAIAIGYTASDQPCFTYPNVTWTGSCTMTNGVDYGYIRINTHYTPSPSTAFRDHLLRHEFGHILGMIHSPCIGGSDSIMSQTNCPPLRTTLQPADINLINAWYP